MVLALLRSRRGGRAFLAPAAARSPCRAHPASSCPPPTGPVKERSYWSYLRRLVLPPRRPPYGRVCQVGDPILRLPAAPVEVARVGSDEVQGLIRSLVRIMRRERCVALSAPQLGVPLQLFVAEFPEELWREEPPARRQAQEMHPFPLRVVLNPRLRVLDARLLAFPEGCQSISGFAANVARFHAVELSGLNETGQPTTWQASGWTARIIQHEMDHLQGILFIDKMDSKTFVNLQWAANE